MKNGKWQEYSGGGRLYAAILTKMPKDRQKMGIDALLEAGRWLCGWCKEFNTLGQAKCESCGMPRRDWKP